MALSKTTQDHDEIKAWAERRGALPAEVESTESGGGPGIVRLMFPKAPNANDSALKEIGWEDFFAKFDASNLALVYQEVTAEGAESNFNRLIHPDHEDHPGKGAAAKKTVAKKAAGKKVVAKKAVAKKTPAKTASAGKSVPAKTTAKTAPAKKTAAKKTVAKKTATTKTAAKKTVAKKAVATKTVAKKAVAKTVAKKAVASKTPAKKAVAKKIAARR